MEAPRSVETHTAPLSRAMRSKSPVPERATVPPELDAGVMCVFQVAPLCAWGR